jgi:hypothetical protein
VGKHDKKPEKPPAKRPGRGSINPNAIDKMLRSKDGTDSFCTECGQWYDSRNDADVNRHAH